MEVVRKYETGNFSLSDKVKDLNTRFVWDMLWLGGLGGFICKNIYAYANDTHITTALKVFPTYDRKAVLNERKHPVLPFKPFGGYLWATRPPSLGYWVLLGTYETSLKAKEAKTEERIRVARARVSQWVKPCKCPV